MTEEPRDAVRHCPVISIGSTGAKANGLEAPKRPALLMQSAAAIEILTVLPDADRQPWPIWISSSTSDGSTIKKGLRLIIDIPGEEVKNGKPLRYELNRPLPPEL